MTKYFVGSGAQGIPEQNQGHTVAPLPATIQRWPSGQELLDAKLIERTASDSESNRVGVTLADSQDRITSLIAASAQSPAQSKIVVSGPLLPADLWATFPLPLRPFLIRLTSSDLMETETRHLLAQPDLRLSEFILSASPEVLSTDAPFETTRLSEIGPGKSTLRLAPIRKALQAVLRTLKLSDYAQKCLEAGILLHHDFLDESHQISQTLEGIGRPATADYWHGIMHRREPDAGNASYWFRRVGAHPALQSLGQNLTTWLEELHVPSAVVHHAETVLTKKQAVDPYHLIELSQSALKNPGSDVELTVKHIQNLEVFNLLTYCLNTAPAA